MMVNTEDDEPLWTWVMTSPNTGHESHQRGTNAHLTPQEVTASTSVISFFFLGGGKGGHFEHIQSTAKFKCKYFRFCFLLF